MNGSLPPSSSDTGVTVSAARFITRLHLRRAGEHDHVVAATDRALERRLLNDFVIASPLPTVRPSVDNESKTVRS
jgi:hypothetical protein